MSVLCPEPSISPRVKAQSSWCLRVPLLWRAPHGYSALLAQLWTRWGCVLTHLLRDITRVSTLGTFNELFHWSKTFVTKISVWPGLSFKPSLKCHLCNETHPDHVI